MELESLANELLLKLFEYLDGVNLIHAFYGLNSRLNDLLLSHHNSFQFDFRHISKDNFDNVCQQHLPFIIDQVTSIQLSDDHSETPNLSKYFLSYGFTLDRFHYLKSLSLYSIDSISTLFSTTSQSLPFPNLTHLSLINCPIIINVKDYTIFFDNIWSLPKLTHCILNGSIPNEMHLLKLSIVSSSIENLFLGDCFGSSRCLYHLLKHTPNLRQLYTIFSGDDQYANPESITLSLTSLRIAFHGLANPMIEMFEKMPNLSSLTLLTSTIAWDGNQWEEILVRCFPQLILFRFRMDNYLLDQDTYIDQLLDTFRTPFWLDQHQWYVRCQWIPRRSENTLNVYTLPYAFTDLRYKDTWHLKSTCSTGDNYDSYDRVQSFRDYSYLTISLHGFDVPHFRLPNLRDLTIIYPDRMKTLTWFPSLNQLVSLNMSIQTISDYGQLQELLVRSPRLYSLYLRIHCHISEEFFQLTNSSVRRLHISTFSKTHYFTSKDCDNLIGSPLGRQCEVLSIDVRNRINALSLIQRMSKLRFLCVRCRGEKMRTITYNDNFVLWLRTHLSPACSINRNGNPEYVEVWISRQTKEPILPEVKNENSRRPLKLIEYLFSQKKGIH